LPADDASVEVRYRDPTQMGKVYVLPAGVDRPVAGYDDDLGPDADDPALTLELWRDRIRRHPGELKNLLKNQAFVAGIGNAYSDEVLHAARLLPFRKRSTLGADEVDELYAATRDTMKRAIGELRTRVPPTFERQARDWLAVHDKGGQACPRCGTRISEVKPGGFVTSFCRGCQLCPGVPGERGGRGSRDRQDRPRLDRVALQAVRGADRCDRHLVLRGD